jgi:hypothetical protein
VATDFFDGLPDTPREVFSIPRGVMVRSLLLKHWYHHRGELSVYLHLLDVPIYDRSADENPFA